MSALLTITHVIILLGYTLLFVYCNVTILDAQNFTHSVELDAENRYHLYWEFDDKNITFEVSVQTLGYVGLGFSTNGGMAGSDIIIGWVDGKGKVHVWDCHALGNQQPEVDTIQNVKVIYGSQNSSHTTIRFIRSLQTCDRNDTALAPGTVRLIWAYHENDPDENGLMGYHAESRGTRSVLLLVASRPIIESPDVIKDMNLINSQVPIPNRRTLYWCQSFELPKLNRKHHLIRVEPVIQPGHEFLVHHIVVYGCLRPVSRAAVNFGHPCYHRAMPADWWHCNAVLLAWSIGGGVHELPSHVGIPFGVPDDPTLIVMETHYDNPSNHAGIRDSSGLRLILTPELRQYDAGVFQTGTVVSGRQSMVNRTEGIHSIGVIFHSHLLGRGIRLRHFRNGRELELIAEDKTYDFNLQVLRYLKEERLVLPGDGLITECVYNSSQIATVTFGGLRTVQEMCLSFVLYYPRINLTECSTIPSQDYLNNFRNPLQRHGTNWVSRLIFRVDWRGEDTRREFQMYTTRTGTPGFQAQCRNGPQYYMGHSKGYSDPH
ncbi:DBH-like monooxygenase protein 1 [Liolophura sinensis]|uniref:DBH-like monooxygenase protein 1 n=1 Tax=Liolophura sinensis TaxID=3198878 RepID=UPI0031589207